MQCFVLHHDENWSARYEPKLVELPQCLILTQCIQCLSVLFFFFAAYMLGRHLYSLPQCKIWQQKEKKKKNEGKLSRWLHVAGAIENHSAIHTVDPHFCSGKCVTMHSTRRLHTLSPLRNRETKKPVHPSCGVTYRTLTPSCPNITDPKQSTKHREPAQSHHYRQLGTPGGRAVKLGVGTRDTWRSPR